MQWLRSVRRYRFYPQPAQWVEGSGVATAARGPQLWLGFDCWPGNVLIMPQVLPKKERRKKKS